MHETHALRNRRVRRGLAPPWGHRLFVSRPIPVAADTNAAPIIRDAFGIPVPTVLDTIYSEPDYHPGHSGDADDSEDDAAPGDGTPDARDGHAETRDGDGGEHRSDSDEHGN